MKPHGRVSGRELKQLVAGLLIAESFPVSLDAVAHLPVRQVVNPLFAFFCDANPLRRWRSVTAMGMMVSGLAENDMESARVVMRRFMWNLNEESGGIGWGCPEAMGECMARSERLADEYSCILWSYLHPERNFIEHPALQEGVLWGVGRLAYARSAPMDDVADRLRPFLASPVPALRGLAARACRAAPADARLVAELENLATDRASFTLYHAERLEPRRVAEMAAAALTLMRGRREER